MPLGPTSPPWLSFAQDSEHSSRRTIFCRVVRRILTLFGCSKDFHNTGNTLLNKLQS